jgi:hypothetical protein
MEPVLLENTVTPKRLGVITPDALDFQRYISPHYLLPSTHYLPPAIGEMTHLAQNRGRTQPFWPFCSSNGDICKSMCIVGDSAIIEKNRGFSSNV